MTAYESAQYPFTIQHPAAWTPQPTAGGAAASWEAHAAGTPRLIIFEEDLAPLEAGELTLDQYIEFTHWSFQMQEAGLTVLSDQRTANAQGLPVAVIEYQTDRLGFMNAVIFYYVHEGTVAFVAVYEGIAAQLEDLRPAIDYSFDSFRVTD